MAVLHFISSAAALATLGAKEGLLKLDEVQRGLIVLGIWHSRCCLHAILGELVKPE